MIHGQIQRLILTTLVFPIALWAADRQVGTWKLNLEKSDYTHGHPAPQDETVIIQEQEGGVKITVDGHDEKGNVIHHEYSPKYDNKDVQITGAPTLGPLIDTDTIAVQRLDDSTFVHTTKKNGKVVATGRIVISKDGKIRTGYWKGINAKGEPISWVVVLDRQ
jgi:hypothetical protein